MRIIVVGAGVVGAAVAYELASRGASVRLVDSRAPGEGATQASAGMLAPHTEGHAPPLHTLGVRSLALYDRFIARLTEDSGRTVEYERQGTLQVALDATEGGDLAALAEAMTAAGIDHELLDAASARRMEPQLPASTTAALRVHDQGYVGAIPLVQALAAAAARHGAAVERARVLAVEDGVRPRVATDAGVLDADAVVVAAGAWAGAMETPPREPGHVKPIRGQLLHLRLPARPASHVLWGSRCYVVPWRDGTVLVGATAEDVGFDETATASGVRRLLTAAAELLPPLDAATLAGVRVGLRPMTRDELPAIGASSTMRGMFYATGHYRNGVLLAPLTAALLADLVLEGREAPELALVRPARLGL